MKDDVAIIQKNSIGMYSSADKYIAILFLEYTAQEIGGDFIPKWEIAKAALGIPEADLKEWWKERKTIIEAAGHGQELLPSIIATKTKILTLSALNEVERRGLQCFNNKDLIAFIKESVHIARLLEDKSTANIALGTGVCDAHIIIK